MGIWSEKKLATRVLYSEVESMDKGTYLYYQKFKLLTQSFEENAKV